MDPVQERHPLHHRVALHSAQANSLERSPAAIADAELPCETRAYLPPVHAPGQQPAVREGPQRRPCQARTVESPNPERSPRPHACRRPPSVQKALLRHGDRVAKPGLQARGHDLDSSVRTNRSPPNATARSLIVLWCDAQMLQLNWFAWHGTEAIYQAWHRDSNGPESFLAKTPTQPALWQAGQTKSDKNAS